MGSVNFFTCKHCCSDDDWFEDVVPSDATTELCPACMRPMDQLDHEWCRLNIIERGDEYRLRPKKPGCSNCNGKGRFPNPSIVLTGRGPLYVRCPTCNPKPPPKPRAPTTKQLAEAHAARCVRFCAGYDTGDATLARLVSAAREVMEGLDIRTCPNQSAYCDLEAQLALIQAARDGRGV